MRTQRVFRVFQIASIAFTAAMVVGCGTSTREASTPAIAEVDMSVGTADRSFAGATVRELVDQSHAVLRGRFRPDPTVLGHQVEKEAGIDESRLVWEFEVTESLRDVYPEQSAAHAAIGQQGVVRVSAVGTNLGKVRGAVPFADYYAAHPSEWHFNSFPTDREVIVFLRPGAVTLDEIKKDPSLAAKQVVSAGLACFDAATLEGSCKYAADAPGGKPIGRGKPGTGVPEFTRAALDEALGSSQVVVTDRPDLVRAEFTVEGTEAEG